MGPEVHTPATYITFVKLGDFNDNGFHYFVSFYFLYYIMEKFFREVM